MIDARTPTQFTEDDAFTSGAIYASRHRAYDPSIGRWTRQDPKGFVDGPNSYEATLSNPIQFLDPLGLQTTQKHDRSSCTTCNSSDAKKDYADAMVIDDTASNATNCIRWAMNNTSSTFAAHLRMGMKQFDDALNANDAADRIQKHLDKMIPEDYGGQRLDDPSQNCPCGSHKIAVFVRKYAWWRFGGRDVHMITEHTDGSWSGKPSYGETVKPQNHADVVGEAGVTVTLVGYYCVKGPARATSAQRATWAPPSPPLPDMKHH